MSSFFFFVFFFKFFECTYTTMNMFLVLFCSDRDGMVYDSPLVPSHFQTGMILPSSLFGTCLFSPIEMICFDNLLCDHRQDAREVS